MFLFKQNVYLQVTDIDNNKDFIDTLDSNSKTPINNTLPLECKVFRIKEIDKAYIIDIDVKVKTQYFSYTIISLKKGKQDLKK